MVNKPKIWKPVQLDSNVLAGGLDGLIGIEECTDYDTNTVVTKKKIKHNLPRSDNKSPIKKKKLMNESGNRPILQDYDLYSPSKSGATQENTCDTTQHHENERNLSNLEDEVLDLQGWNSFGFPKLIIHALQDLQFSQPTQIQSLTLPAAILGRRDILGAAETGSGKTLAFGLPILTGILQLKEQSTNKDSSETLNASDSDSESDFEKEEGELETGCIKSIKDVGISMDTIKPLYALILTPTRELAVQIRNHLVAVAKYTGINIAVVVGGMAAVKQERILSKGPEIVVATPGRLWELIQQGNSHLSQIDNIRFFAIDETDRMLERGHFQELHSLLERINFDEAKKKQRQNFVFSATLTLVHELPTHLKTKSRIKKSKRIHDLTPAQKLQKIVKLLGITNPKVVDITQGTGTSGTLTECRITCGIQDKDYYVYYFLMKHPGRTLIFCNSIGCVKRLTTLLTLLECHPLPLHASMQQRQRLRNLERFRDIENSVLVATDVAARGLDIPFVEHVLHYQTPRTSESYVHRSGRTARATRQGITILLIEPNELHNYLRLCRTLGKGEDLPIFPVQQNYLNAVKARVNLTRELDKLQLQVKKAKSEAGWFQKAAEDMDIIVDDSVRKYDTKEAEHCKKVANIKRKQLISLLATPIFPKGFNGRHTLSGELSDLLAQKEHKDETALEVMKNSIEISNKQKKKSIPLYKPKKKYVNMKGVDGTTPSFKSKKDQHKQFKSKAKFKAKSGHK